MILDHRNHARVVGTVGVVEVGFVHQDHGRARSFGDKLAHFVLRRDAGGGIVRVADVNEPVLRGGAHLREVMTETAGERNFHDLSAIGFRVLDERFESRLGRYQIAPRRSSECFCTKFKNFARAVAE